MSTPDRQRAPNAGDGSMPTRSVEDLLAGVANLANSMRHKLEGLAQERERAVAQETQQMRTDSHLLLAGRDGAPPPRYQAHPRHAPESHSEPLSPASLLTGIPRLGFSPGGSLALPPGADRSMRSPPRSAVDAAPRVVSPLRSYSTNNSAGWDPGQRGIANMSLSMTPSYPASPGQCEAPPDRRWSYPASPGPVVPRMCSTSPMPAMVAMPPPMMGGGSQEQLSQPLVVRSLVLPAGSGSEPLSPFRRPASCASPVR